VRAFLMGIMFWLMTLTGGGALAICLLLPAIIDYQNAKRTLADKTAVVTQLEYQNTAIEKQIAHSQNDPAYLERVARREFGLETPGVETVRITADVSTSAPSPDTQPASQPETPIEQRLAQIEQLARSNPAAAVFILPETRPIVMSLAGGLLLAAVVLLNPWSAPRRAAKPVGA